MNTAEERKKIWKEIENFRNTREQNIKELKANGYSAKKIAEKVKEPVSTVLYILSK